MTDGSKDCDISVTTRELVTLLKEAGIQFSADREEQLKATQEGKFDAPFDEYSGSAYIFGKTAGVTESVVRYVYKANNLEFNKSVISSYLLWEQSDKL